MNILKIISLFLLTCMNVNAQVITEINQLWSKSKDNLEYINYQKEFIEYNNYLGLDNKCYKRSGNTATIFLFLTNKGEIENVFIESNMSFMQNQCFVNVYKNIPIKPPPFSPLIIKMEIKDI